MITLDERLKACAKYVSGKGTVCDVGTDHAYLPAYLILSEKCRNAVAGDINDGPLEFAEQTLNKYKLSDKIKLVKSDGLKNISPENVSGMAEKRSQSYTSAYDSRTGFKKMAL